MRRLHIGLVGDDVVNDAEQFQIAADQLHHLLDRTVPEQRQPFGLGGADVAITVFGRQRFADGDQILARVQALGNVADTLAERFAVAQVDRPRERIDLPARVVDVIFADHPMPRERQQVGQRIADHRAPAMPHVHRPRRVGRDILDVDGDALAQPRPAIVAALGQDRPQLVAPDVAGQRDVEEARPRDLGARHLGQPREVLREAGGDQARVRLRRLREDQRGVGREIAVRRVARRLDRHCARVEPGGQVAVAHQPRKGIGDVRSEAGIESGQD